jgi:phosphonate transport system substrate-binding protein
VLRISKHRLLLLALLGLSLLAVACGEEERAKAGGMPAAGSSRTLNIGAIPDQDTAVLVRRFSGMADYLTRELGMETRYVPSVDYAAVVTGFKNGDIHLAWFGGLTGVQARKMTPGAVAIAQRPIDTQFHSAFIVQKDLPAQTLADLKSYSFTFGSESSTSGHLMPRYFLQQAGVDADRDFKGLPNYSGSHEATWKLVETGAFQAGALNEPVWDAAVRDGRVDVNKVRKMYTTDAYYDYNWTVRGDLDATFGAGFTDRLKTALLTVDEDPALAEILEGFSPDGFIEADNSLYGAIEEVSEHLELIE